MVKKITNWWRSLNIKSKRTFFTFTIASISFILNNIVLLGALYGIFFFERLLLPMNIGRDIFTYFTGISDSHSFIFASVVGGNLFILLIGYLIGYILSRVIFRK